MRLCNQRRSHLSRAKFILGVRGRSGAADVVAHPAKEAGYEEQTKRKGRSNMIKKLLGAAAMAAIAYAFVPVHAARLGVGCSGDNLAKTEGAVEKMTEGPSKLAAQREIVQAQDALLSGNMSRCAMHLAGAMRAETPGQTPYANTFAQAPYADTRAQAPAETRTQAPSQPQQGWGWQPVKPAL
jgi:hypothetical protein